ncbi:MAG: hypothetical protein HY558_03460 [Euryarchaeota archaeon]|nr:hypothetical protein [Euryarchaeota archaeon]
MTLDPTDWTLLSALGLLGALAVGVTARAYLRTRYRSMAWLSIAFLLLALGSTLEHLLVNQFHWDHHDSSLLGVHLLTAMGFLAVIASALRARQVPGPAPVTH